MLLAPWLVAILADACVCLICFLLLTAYTHTLGALLRALADGLHKINVWGVHVFSFLASGVTAVDSAINAALVAGVDGTRWALVKLWNYGALLIHKTLEAMADLAETTYSAIAHTVDRVVPALISTALRPLFGAVHSLSHQLAYLWRVVTHLAQRVEHVALDTLPKVVITVPRIAAHEAAKAVTATAGAVAGTLPRLGSIERTLHGIDETLKDTLRKVSPAALAGVFVASVLSITGLSWLRCGNVGRAGKAICGLNANVLEGLLAGLLSIFGTIGIVKFAEDVQGVVKEFGSEVGHFWRADAIGSGGDRALGSATLD